MILIEKRETASTNDDLKLLPSPENFTVELSFVQTDGKGSNGRTFVSPYGGAYFSILFYPEKEILPKVTPLVAVAVREAVEELTGKKCGIKWVNDLYCEGKKVCGILTESRTAGERTTVIAGIGVNLFKSATGYGEYENKAGYILDKPVDEKTIVEFVKKVVEKIEIKSKDDSFMIDYDKHCLLKDKTVAFFDGKKTENVFVKGVASDGGLIIVRKDGSEEKVITGEVVF